MPNLFQLLPGLDMDAYSRIEQFPVGVRFTATLDGSRFRFEKEKRPAFMANADEMYLVDGLAISGTVSELLFSNAINASYNNGLFSLAVKNAGDYETSPHSPFLFGNYSQSLAYSTILKTNHALAGKQDQFYFELDGELFQIEDLMEVNSISLFISAYIIKIPRGMLK
jgi:hypothetical protein